MMSVGILVEIALTFASLRHEVKPLVPGLWKSRPEHPRGKKGGITIP